MTVVELAVPPHPFVDGAEEVARALDRLAANDPVFLPVDAKRAALLSLAESSSRLLVLLGRLSAGSAEVAELDGHRDTASWLAHQTRAGGAQERRALRLGRACDERWRILGRGLGAGDVNVEQGHVIVRALDGLVEGRDLIDADAEEWSALLVRAEAHLVERAALFGPRELRRLGERILEVVAPAHAERVEERLLLDAERKAQRVTALTIHPLGDGTALVKARVPEAVAVRLRTTLEAFTNPRVLEGGRDAPRFGRPRDRTGERVPYDRRLGNAFVALLEGLDPARLPLHGGDATTLVVTMDLATLVEGIGVATIGGTAGAPPGSGSRAVAETRLSASEVRRLACTAGIVPAVLGSDSVPLDLGRTTRLYGPYQRKALALRDGGCRAHGCSIPATWCEAHHLKPWSEGGSTDLADGVLLCAHHHQLIHDERYVWVRSAGGEIRFRRR